LIVELFGQLNERFGERFEVWFGFEFPGSGDLAPCKTVNAYVLRFQVIVASLSTRVVAVSLEVRLQ